MTQDERWLMKWQQYMNFMEKNKRCPSKYKPEDMTLVNWAKHNRKIRNKGLMEESRKEKFKKLCEVAASYRRVNQHAYLNNEEDLPTT